VAGEPVVVVAVLPLVEHLPHVVVAVGGDLVVDLLDDVDPESVAVDGVVCPDESGVVTGLLQVGEIRVGALLGVEGLVHVPTDAVLGGGLPGDDAVSRGHTQRRRAVGVGELDPACGE